MNLKNLILLTGSRLTNMSGTLCSLSGGQSGRTPGNIGKTTYKKIISKDDRGVYLLLMRRLVLSNESGECETSAEGVVLGRPSRPVGPVEVRVDLSLQSSIVWFFSWVPNSVFGSFCGFQTMCLVLFEGSKLRVWFFSWIPNCVFGSFCGFQTVCLVFAWVPNCVFSLCMGSKL